MKKGAILFICICCLLLCLWGCDTGEELSLVENTGVGVYRVISPELQQDGSLITPQPVTQTDPDVAELIQLFLSEPQEKGLEKAFPDGVEILNWTEDEGEVSLYLNRQFWDLDNYDRMVAQYCLTLTLCSLDTVDLVSIYVDGVPYAMGLTAEDVILYDMDTIPTERKIKLYFKEKDSRYLNYEYHTLSMDDTAQAEHVVLEELLRSPYDEGLESCIPEGTQLLSAVTEDGLCTVNLSGEFLEAVPQTLDLQRLCIYSIVDSLTMLSGTDQVMILVEGEIVDAFGLIPLDAPLTQNDAIIGPVNGAKGEQDVNLYLAVEGENKLAGLPTVVTVESGERIEEVVLDALFTREAEAGFVNLFHSGDTPLSMEISFGVCVLDFPENFYVSRQPEELRLAVEAIVHTLTELDGVKAVRFLMNGNVPVYGDMDLSGALIAHEGYLIE